MRDECVGVWGWGFVAGGGGRLGGGLRGWRACRAAISGIYAGSGAYGYAVADGDGYADAAADSYAGTYAGAYRCAAGEGYRA